MAHRSAAEVARLTALFAFLAGLVWLSRPTRWSVLAGAPLVVAGEAIRLWAAGHLFKTEQLITSGPYRWTRNPLYLGRLLLFTGVALMAWRGPLINFGVLVLGWVVFFGYYLPRKERIEPARLLAAHGSAYRAYHAAVPALFPTRRPYPNDGGRWRTDRCARNREWLTALGFALLVAVFTLRALGVAL